MASGRGFIRTFTKSRLPTLQAKKPYCGISVVRRTITMEPDTCTESKNLPHWQLCASVCLTRLPMVTPDLSEIELKYFKLLRQQELERSVLSEWEMEKNRQIEIIRAVEMGERDPRDVDFKTTHQDIEDEEEIRLKEFLDSSAEGSLVDDSNFKDVNRKMKESIVYIIKRKLGNDEVWYLPGLPISDDESMRQCAERALSAHVTNDFQAKIFSNAPSAFFKYKFPKGVRLKSTEEHDGAKLFIYSAIAKSLKDFSVTAEKQKASPTDLTDPSILDYAWVTREEMKKHFKPKYYEAVRKILY